MSGAFKDHFSGVAHNYADCRPTYPPELFAWLAAQCAGHELAWDCGAGSGQASIALANHFARVIATDASAAQIAQAVPHERIAYRVAPAERSGLPDHSVNLVTIAQALHWFDLERFYAEVRRVLKPGGLIAAWTYGVQQVEGEAVNALVQAFYADVVGPYWPPERHHVETGYHHLAFPFRTMEAPALAMQLHWTLDQLLGYFRSWSASARYLQARGTDPVAELEPALRAVWGDAAATRAMTWPLAVRAGISD